MALVTRCPECATLFKVVPDQLRISEGWVRCGHCNEVFDASVDLHQQSNESLAAASRTAPPTVSSRVEVVPEAQLEADEPASTPPLHLEFPEPPATVAVFAAADVPAQAGPHTYAVLDEALEDALGKELGDEHGYNFDESATASAEAALEAEFDRELLAIEAAADHADSLVDQAVTGVEVDEPAAPGDDLAFGEETDAATEPEDELSPADGDGRLELEDEFEDDAADPAPVEPSVPDMPTMAEDAVFVAPFVSAKVNNTPEPKDSEDLDEASAVVMPQATATGLSSAHYSFLHTTAAQNSVWRKPAVRYGLMVLVALLALGLLLQWIVVQRELVAARWPQSRAFLTSVCAPLGCTVPALRRIDAIAIDSSAFTSLRRGAYRLNVVLKNRGADPLAVPSIELALTDTQEQPVIRRVIPPHEFGVAAETIDAHGEWVAAVELAVPDGDTAARIVGYRLLAFYP